MPDSEPPICSYEGSDYQSSFWEQGGREYEDRAEAAALKRLLPPAGRLLLELGAGAGRNTSRYAGFQRVVLLDYSRTQLEQAQARLGKSWRYIYVAADIYRLPFVAGAFDAATMIRVLHHMAEPLKALAQVREALARDAVFVLEFANKRNLKAILRFWLGGQDWNPFSPEPVEFARLNYDFHPRQVQAWVEQLGFEVERKLAVSHFRSRTLKRVLPAGLLAGLDGLLQPTGRFWELTPSVFYRLRRRQPSASAADAAATDALLFRCPECGHSPLTEGEQALRCGGCGRIWSMAGGIYDFRASVETPAT